MSEQALWLLGPLFNLEGRFHFSLVEWFTHWHDDVFGDLEYIDDGRGHAARGVRARCCSTTPAWAPRSTRSSSGRDGVTRPLPRRGRDAQSRSTADECIVTVPVRAAAAHGDQRPRRREVVHDPERLLRPRAQDLHAVQPPLVGGGLRDHPRRHGHGPRDPERGLHAGRPGPVDRARACSSRPTPGSRTRWRTRCSTSTSGSPRRSRTSRRSTRRRAETFEFGISHDWALDRHGGGIGPLFRPFEMTSRFYDDIVRPVGRVWFANDACDRRGRRWIEGAIAAAVKNAYAIHAGMRNELPVAERPAVSGRSVRRAGPRRVRAAGRADARRPPARHDARRPRGPRHRPRGPGRRAAGPQARRGHRGGAGRPRRRVRAASARATRSWCSRRRTGSAAGSTRCAPFAPGLYAEAGGMRIPRAHDLTLAYCELFGLPMRPFVMGNPKGLVHIGGAADDQGGGGRATRRGCRSQLAEHERGRNADALWEAAIGDLRDDGRARGRRPPGTHIVRRVRPVLALRVPARQGLVARARSSTTRS